jgi:fumarylacetoacetate (FAA) hydrolase
VRLCTFRSGDGPPEGWPGRVDGEHIVQLDAPDLITVLARRGQAAEAARWRAADVELLAPVPRPPSVRDFFAFEQHIATARANRGASVPAEWYEFPVFYFTNPAAITGPDVEIPYPAGTAELDYELEVAAIIGADGEIGGFTVMNDWSARDIQRKEMRVGLGPAKAKDFATSFGPVLVTADEFDGSRAVMLARVNGEERSRGQLADLYYPWPAILAQAARNTELRPGDIIGSGTVGTGCILERGDGRWLQPGDVVEMEVEGLGILRNRIGPGGRPPGTPRSPLRAEAGGAGRGTT